MKDLDIPLKYLFHHYLTHKSFLLIFSTIDSTVITICMIAIRKKNRLIIFKASKSRNQIAIHYNCSSPVIFNIDIIPIRKYTLKLFKSSYFSFLRHFYHLQMCHLEFQKAFYWMAFFYNNINLS